MAAGQVCLALELVARPAEQSFFVVELERGLVPGDNLMPDLMRFGPRPDFTAATGAGI